jgi:O-antigen ligase
MSVPLPATPPAAQWPERLARGALAVALLGSFMAPAWTNIGAAIALLCVVASEQLRRRAVALARSPIFIASLVFLGWVALSTLWSEAPWRHRLGAVSDWRVLLVMSIGLVVFHEAAQKRRLLTIFVAVATLAAAVVFLFKAFEYSPFADRPPGMLLRNYATQTMTFAAAAIAAAALLLDRRSAQAGRWRIGSRDLAALGAVAILCASIASVSVGRSGALALGAGAVVLALGMRRDWLAWLLPAVVVCGLAAAVAFATPMRQHFATGVYELEHADEAQEATSIGLRVHMWRSTVALVRERPVLGYGGAGLLAAYERLLGAKYSGWRAQPFADPHNQYLRIAAEGGLVGLALFVVLLAAILRHAAPQPWRSAALGLLAGWCVTSLLNSHFQAFNEGHLLFLLLGVLLAPQDDDERVRPGKNPL